MSEPGGYGPWFCAFVVNTANRPKKYTHIVAHTMPHLVVDALNQNKVSGSSKKRLREDEKDGCWILVFKIGPFNYWMDSVLFLNQWLCKTRGKTHRMEKGLELFALYREQFHLCMWTQTREREDALQHFQHKQPVVVITPVLEIAAAAAAAIQEKKKEDEEETEESKIEAFKKWLEDTRALFTRPEQPTLGAIRARIY